jgi:hypothetical protein
LPAEKSLMVMMDLKYFHKHTAVSVCLSKAKAKAP